LRFDFTLDRTILLANEVNAILPDRLGPLLLSFEWPHSEFHGRGNLRYPIIAQKIQLNI
jgi:hypothetical protein